MKPGLNHTLSQPEPRLACTPIYADNLENIPLCSVGSSRGRGNSEVITKETSTTTIGTTWASTATDMNGVSAP